MIRLEGKVMLITGGTAGFGLATARLAVELGAQVVIAGRRADRGHAAVSGLGAGVLFVRADVAREADVQRMVGAAVERFGRLDILVNNAGIIRRRPVLEEDAAGWDEVLAVNLGGTFLCCRHALPHLIASKGAIVNVASTLAFRTPAGHTPAYDASKAGILALTRALAVRYGPDGVRANAVCPAVHPHRPQPRRVGGVDRRPAGRICRGLPAPPARDPRRRRTRRHLPGLGRGLMGHRYLPAG